METFCPGCNQKSNFFKKEYFKTMPKYLLVAMNRFVLVNWVPKKLNALINMPEEYDFKNIVFTGLEPNEVLLKEDKPNQVLK